MAFIRSFLAGFFLLTGCMLHAQTTHSDSLKMICQTWKIKEVYVHNFEDDEKDELDDFIKNTRMQFKSDMSFIAKSQNENIKGKWQFNSSTKSITINMDDNEDEVLILKIISLSMSGFKFESGTPEESLVSSGLLIPVKQ